MKLISRSTWGAAAPTGPGIPVSWSTTEAVLHHTADPFTEAGPKRPGLKWFRRAKTSVRVRRAIRAYQRGSSRVAALERAAMRSMQAYHQHGQGWIDLGYHAVIFPSGTAYEGRAPRTLGAHALGGGNVLPGISLAGNFERQQPTPRALEALRDLRLEWGIGRLTPHSRVPGNATACPGRNLMSTLGL